MLGEKVVESIKNLTNSIQGAISIADKFQKSTTALGLSYEGAVKQFGTSVEDLRGGFIDRLNNGLTLLAAGFQGNTKGISKLVNQQQLTNGNFRLTASRLASLEATLRLTREQTGDLAETILKTSLSYTLTTDKLIDVLGAFQDGAAALDLGGLQDLPKVFVELAGSFGPQLTKDVKAFAALLADPSMETQLQLTTMGLGRIREEFAAANGPAAQMQILTNGLATAGARVKELAGNAEDFFVGASVPVKVMGKASMSVLNLSKNLDKREIQAAQNRALFGESIENLKREITVPLKAVFNESVYPLLRDLVMGINGLIKPKMEEAAKFLGDLFDGLPTNTDDRLRFIASGIGGAIDGIVLAAAHIRNGFMEVYNNSVNFSRQLASLVADIHDIRENPGDVAGRIGAGLMGEVIDFTVDSIDSITGGIIPRGQNADMVTGMLRGISGQGNNGPVQMVDVNRGKIDIASMEQNKYRNAMLTALEELAAKRNQQLEGLPDEIAEATRPTEIIDASLTTLGDVMAEIARQNVEENPLLEELVRATNSVAQNTERSGTFVTPDNGG